jgi:hypothetical protein
MSDGNIFDLSFFLPTFSGSKTLAGCPGIECVEFTYNTEKATILCVFARFQIITLLRKTVNYYEQNTVEVSHYTTVLVPLVV